jgi:Family of unknown function (DUF5761)
MSWTASFPWANVLSDFYTQTAIPNAPKHTGRLPLSDQEAHTSVPPAVLFAPEPGMASSVVKERIQFRHSSTPVNEQFFSRENMDILQDRIRTTVRGMVNADIDRQSDTDLMLVMRSYYLQYAGESVEQLNERVVGFCSNRIAVEVEAYRYYRQDILDFPAPIARPLDTHVYGTRVGELKSFF